MSVLYASIDEVLVLLIVLWLRLLPVFATCGRAYEFTVCDIDGAGVVELGLCHNTLSRALSSSSLSARSLSPVGVSTSRRSKL